MREVLIDGYNLIRQSVRLADQERRGGLEAGREGLIRLLGAYRAATGDRVVVVFDGDDGVAGVPRAKRRQGVEVVFSRPPESADDVIVRRIRKRHGKKAMLVVSSDREVRRAARRNRIADIGAEAFEAEARRRIAEGQKQALEADASAPEAGDAAYWEDRFRREKGMFEEE